VESQGVRFDLRTDRDPGAYPPLFKPLLRCLFASRRKTVKNNLENLAASLAANRVGKTELPGICAQALGDAGIKVNERAERLDVDDFAALALSLEQALGRAGLGVSEDSHGHP
jgi:16S rRNA A1518/A1519 N6-dimethyltransferase RsmA/KsgA/DIM1 with predicted DNA glycosylase/AP lyase activity